MSIKQYIPNTITSLNLSCGFIGIILAFSGNIEWSIYLIWLAMFFDFLDGFTARVLNVHSYIGKELDSLADMVTFGVLPAIIIYQMMMTVTTIVWLPYISVLIAIFSALRLAKFNLDENQTSVFIGVPTPANALFLSSLPLVQHQYPSIVSLEVLVIITVVCSLWLVAPVELFSLKFKSVQWKGNQLRILFLIICILLLAIFKLMAFPVIILTYVLLSLTNSALKPKT